MPIAMAQERAQESVCARAILSKLTGGPPGKGSTYLQLRGLLKPQRSSRAGGVNGVKSLAVYSFRTNSAIYRVAAATPAPEQLESFAVGWHLNL